VTYFDYSQDVRARVKVVLTRIADLLNTQDVKEDTSINEAIDSALIVFGNFIPDEKIADFTATATTRLFAVPTAWEVGFSTFIKVFYPAGGTDELEIDEDLYRIYRSDATTYKVETDIDIVKDKIIRMHFTAAHTLPKSGTPVTTILERHKPGFVFLVVSHVLLSLSVAATKEAGGPSGAHAIGFRIHTRSGRLKVLSDDYHKRFLQAVGLGGDNPPGMAVRNFNPRYLGWVTFRSRVKRNI